MWAMGARWRLAPGPVRVLERGGRGGAGGLGRAPVATSQMTRLLSSCPPTCGARGRGVSSRRSCDAYRHAAALGYHCCPASRPPQHNPIAAGLLATGRRGGAHRCEEGAVAGEGERLHLHLERRVAACTLRAWALEYAERRSILLPSSGLLDIYLPLNLVQ